MGTAVVTSDLVAMERLLSVLPSLGVDANDVCRAAGVDIEEVRRHKRAPVTVETAIWNEAAERVPERPLGVTVAERCFEVGLVVTTLYEYIGWSALTWREATLAMRGRHRLDTDAFSTQLVEEPSGSCTLRTERVLPEIDVSYDRIEFGMVRTLKVARQLTQGHPTPTRVTLRRPTTPHLGEYRRVFGVPVELGAPCDAMELPPACLDARLSSGDPELHAELLRIADHELRALAPTEQWPVLLATVERMLPDGDVSHGNVARWMGLTGDILKSLVRRQGMSSWTEVVDAVRRPVAERLLRDRSLTIAGVGYQVGFASPASFTRAFRRWTGMTPEEYRRST